MGVGVGEDTLTAGAVVVATGGFGANPEKLARYFPSAADTGWAWYIGADGSRGDHLDLAAQVGAQVAGFNRGLRLLHADFARIYEAYLPGWLVLVDRQGRGFSTRPHRTGSWTDSFRNEATSPTPSSTGPPSTKPRPLASPGTSRRFPDRPRNRARTGTPTSLSPWSPRARCTTRSPSPRWPRDLPCPRETWRSPSSGTTRPWRRGRTSITSRTPSSSSRSRAPRSTPPRSARPRCALPPAACGWTPGAQVIGESGRPIPGLFTAGESVGGVVGPRYVGSGNSYANCVTFGRIQARPAARMGEEGTWSTCRTG